MSLSTQAVTICVCTMNRPAMLRRCLESIAAGSSQAVEVIVSDDSPDGSDTAAVCAGFAFVRYVRGPRRGLCANRNLAISYASGGHISLLDDDSVVGQDFVARVTQAAATLPPHTILTGAVIDSGSPPGIPYNATFWGHFGLPSTTRLENVNLNCNLFPRSAFNAGRFDERIWYGYEDMDLCSCLLSKGYRIELDAALVNIHLPPPRSLTWDKQRFRFSERARFYTSVKRYAVWQRAPLKALLYVILAPIHRTLGDLKARRWHDLPYCWSDMARAVWLTYLEGKRLRNDNGAAIVPQPTGAASA